MRRRHAVLPHEAGGHCFRQGAGPRLDRFVDDILVFGTQRLRLQARIFFELRSVHQIAEVLPMRFLNANDGYVTVGALIDVVRRRAVRRMPVAAAFWMLPTVTMQARDIAGQDRVNRFLHGHLDDPALAGDRTFEERRHDGGVKMYSAGKVAHRQAGFKGRAVFRPIDAHHAADGLDS